MYTTCTSSNKRGCLRVVVVNIMIEVQNELGRGQVSTCNVLPPYLTCTGMHYTYSSTLCTLV